MKRISYSKRVNSLLRKKTAPRGPLVLDLFAGCGGLSLGFEAAGFRVMAFESDEHACNSHRNNLWGECFNAYLEAGFEYPKADLIIGGPPCQPFSVNGEQKGGNDSRNGLNIFVSAVRQIKPEIWIFENVKGILFRSKRYFHKILRKMREFGYTVEYRILNAKFFGVPQNRERIIVVGHRGRFIWPSPISPIVTAREALGTMATSNRKSSRYVTRNMAAYIRRYERASGCLVPRDLHLDEPARTLTCRNLAGATGDMQRMCLPNGRRKLLSPREAARLQSFPDWFKFYGPEASRLKQIGNAVPPLVAYKIAKQVRRYLAERGIV